MDPDPGPGPWTVKNLEPEKPDPEKAGLTRTWTLKNLDSEKSGL